MNAARPESGIALSWSGGKDSALALFELRRRGIDVDVLLTTIAEQPVDEVVGAQHPGECRPGSSARRERIDRVSHHGVREELLDAQADAIGIPLVKVRLPNTRGGSCSNPEYEAAIANAMYGLRDRGIRAVAHGDLFLEDLRRYRERNLERAGMSGLFPLWGLDTTEVILRFVELRFKATLCCVDSKLGSDFVGREIDESFLAALPQYVDPAGENGEYHSFVHDGPLFRRPVLFTRGERVVRDGRTFLDLIPRKAEVGALG